MYPHEGHSSCLFSTTELYHLFLQRAPGSLRRKQHADLLPLIYLEADPKTHQFSLLFSFPHFIVLRWGLTLSPRLGCSAVITDCCSIDLPGSSDPPTLAYLVARTTDVCYHAWLIFCILVEMRFYHVGQDDLYLLTL